MQALSPTDLAFLWKDTRNQPMHVAGLNIYSPPARSGPDFVALLIAKWSKHLQARAPFNLRPVLRVGLWHWEEECGAGDLRRRTAQVPCRARAAPEEAADRHGAGVPARRDRRPRRAPGARPPGAPEPGTSDCAGCGAARAAGVTRTLPERGRTATQSSCKPLRGQGRKRGTYQPWCRKSIAENMASLWPLSVATGPISSELGTAAMNCVTIETGTP